MFRNQYCLYSETANTRSLPPHTCLSEEMTKRFSQWLAQHPTKLYIDDFLWSEWIDISDTSPDVAIIDHLTGLMADRVAF